MPNIPGLRSPYDEVGGIVHFGRMLDKIRLHGRGELPPDYVEAMGSRPGAFDQRCCSFLHISHAALTERVLQGADGKAAAGGEGDGDEAILAWACQTGRQPSEEEILVWNNFMTKRGWRDEVRDRVLFRLREAGLPEDSGILTMFDFIDADEGRPPRYLS